MDAIRFGLLYRALAEFNDESAKPLQSTVSTSFESSEKVMHTSNGDVAAENNVDRIKSAISVVQEIAQKRELSIRFAVESETGPAHMKHFIIKCSVGEIEVSNSNSERSVIKQPRIHIRTSEKLHLLSAFLFCFSFTLFFRPPVKGTLKKRPKNMPPKIC